MTRALEQMRNWIRAWCSPQPRRRTQGRPDQTMAADVLRLEPRLLLSITGTVTETSLSLDLLPPGAAVTEKNEVYTEYFWGDPIGGSNLTVLHTTGISSSIVPSVDDENISNFRVGLFAYTSGDQALVDVRQQLRLSISLTINTNHGSFVVDVTSDITLFQDVPAVGPFGGVSSTDVFRMSSINPVEISLPGNKAASVAVASFNADQWNPDSTDAFSEMRFYRNTRYSFSLIGSIAIAEEAPMPEVDFITNGGKSTFVRMGIWDNAYGPNGELMNGQEESKNFVGADSRNFRVRVEDQKSDLDPTRAETITVELYVVDSKGKRRESNRPNSTITLFETGLDTGVFESKGLMLVARDMDAKVATHTGVDALIASWGMQDHRLRLAGLNDTVVAKYKPQNMETIEKKATVFNRGANDERRQLDLNVVWFFAWRDKGVKGVYEEGVDKVLAADQRSTVPTQVGSFMIPRFKVAKELWAPAGLDVRWNLKYTPIPLPQPKKGSKSPYTSNYTVAPLDLVAQEALINSVLKYSPKFEPNSMTIMLTQITGKAGVWTAQTAQRPDRGQQNSQFVFLDRTSRTQSTLAHELFHALYNKDDQRDPQSPVPNQFFTFNTTGGVEADVLNYSRIHPETIDWMRIKPKDIYAIGRAQLELNDGTGNFIVRPYTPE